MSNFSPFHQQGERLPAYISRPFAFAPFGPLPYIYMLLLPLLLYMQQLRLLSERETPLMYTCCGALAAHKSVNMQALTSQPACSRQMCGHTRLCTALALHNILHSSLAHCCSMHRCRDGIWQHTAPLYILILHR